MGIEPSFGQLVDFLVEHELKIKKEPPHRLTKFFQYVLSFFIVAVNREQVTADYRASFKANPTPKEEATTHVAKQAMKPAEQPRAKTPDEIEDLDAFLQGTESEQPAPAPLPSVPLKEPKNDLEAFESYIVEDAERLKTSFEELRKAVKRLDASVAQESPVKEQKKEIPWESRRRPRVPVEAEEPSVDLPEPIQLKTTPPEEPVVKPEILPSAVKKTADEVVEQLGELATRGRDFVVEAEKALLGLLDNVRGRIERALQPKETEKPGTAETGLKPKMEPIRAEGRKVKSHPIPTTPEIRRLNYLLLQAWQTKEDYDAYVFMTELSPQMKQALLDKLDNVLQAPLFTESSRERLRTFIQKYGAALTTHGFSELYNELHGAKGGDVSRVIKGWFRALPKEMQQVFLKRLGTNPDSLFTEVYGLNPAQKKELIEAFRATLP